jgi:hypothetical protein
MVIEREEREWGPDSEDSEPEGYENFKQLLRPESPSSDPLSPPAESLPLNTPLTPALTIRPCGISSPSHSPPSSPIAGPSYQNRHSQGDRVSNPGNSSSHAFAPQDGHEEDELEDDPADLTHEDQDVYYGGGEETMRDDD